MPHLRHTLIALLCTALSAVAYATDGDTARRQLQSLDRQIKQLKSSIGETRSQRSRAAKELQEVEQEIGKIAAKLHKTRVERDRRQQKLNTLEKRQSELRQQQSVQRGLIAEQIRQSYTLGRERQLKMLLNQEDPQSLTRLVSYYDYFNKARSEQLRRYQATLTEISTLIPEITAETEALSAVQRQLTSQHEQLSVQKQRRAVTLGKLDNELSSQQTELIKFDTERKDLESILAAVEREITNIAIPDSYRPFTQMRGQMPWPVAGKPLNSFGARRAGSNLRWQGVQIAGKEGDTIRSIHNGRVVYADWLRGAGLLIIVDHGNDYLSLYAHNQSLLRQEGDWVQGGEAIATLGNSGGQRQAGLYFEIRHKGRPTNPSQWCKK